MNLFKLLITLQYTVLLMPQSVSFSPKLSLLPPRKTHSPLLSTPSSSSSSSYTPEELEKSLSKMTKFTNQYLKNTRTYVSSDPSVPSLVIKGLALHKLELGKPLCPCRYYDDKSAAAKEGYWNCPCVPMRETKTCHCKLFLTEDDWCRGESTSIDLETVKEEVERKEREEGEDVIFGDGEEEEDDDGGGFELEFDE
mmetsp:Transcript_12542/g.22879  ORF Transcript_12542/g.22879 Transcript_12542/m.22879 type:complete len:196 (-) Transcript_12542:51-638(-)